jgi:translation initiation factor 1A
MTYFPSLAIIEQRRTGRLLTLARTACFVLNLGKRKVLTESAPNEMVMPDQVQLFGRVIKLVGGDNIIVKCTDGKVRTCRIRGKIKRRMWIRDNDLVLVAPWDFQSDRADIIWRYISAHAEKIKQDGHLARLEA